MAERSEYQPTLVVDNTGENSSLFKNGDGDGTSGGMEPRVAALEKGFERIEKKLDALTTTVSEMKGQLSVMPSAATFDDLKGSVGEIKGRVDSLPGLGKIALIMGLIGSAMTIIIKWSDFIAAFHK